MTRVRDVETVKKLSPLMYDSDIGKDRLLRNQGFGQAPQESVCPIGVQEEDYESRGKGIAVPRFTARGKGCKRTLFT